jgi:netrin-G3 ligand
VDAQGVTQYAPIPTVKILVSHKANEYMINDLSPFTTYHVNVSAIPSERSYRPPAKITVTTQMAAPQPMVRPDFYGVRKASGGELTVFLPQASEEYGPISHYYVVVIPNSNASNVNFPDQYNTADLNSAPKGGDATHPYIAAKFLQRSIPYTFVLGNGENYEGYINGPLKPKTLYKIFVRAYVDTPQKQLFTSSPFSPELSLDMTQEPPGPPPERPRPGNTPGGKGKNPRISQQGSMTFKIVAPILAVIVFVFLGILICVLRKRKQEQKQPLGEQGAVMTPLMSGFRDTNNAGNGANNGASGPEGIVVNSGNGIGGIASSDPVELRRLNFQTPGMMSHPPIPLADLSSHIELLKMNDNMKFSQEYESIEPGQQFTWDNSSMEINKPKNRYANVIAYDHSRVVLQPIDGIPGSDYINGNYCDGYRKQNAYIATQVSTYMVTTYL